jgi:hypothetical protein
MLYYSSMVIIVQWLSHIYLFILYILINEFHLHVLSKKENRTIKKQRHDIIIIL